VAVVVVVAAVQHPAVALVAATAVPTAAETPAKASASVVS